MTDTLTPAERSKRMSAVRSWGNKSTELLVASLLKVNHVSGWRRNLTLYGRPDFLWRKQKVALFVDGCFWHGCKACYRRPKSNRKFWDAKVQENARRDRLVGSRLRELGWTVIRVKECQLRRLSGRAQFIGRMRRKMGLQRLQFQDAPSQRRARKNMS